MLVMLCLLFMSFWFLCHNCTGLYVWCFVRLCKVFSLFVLLVFLFLSWLYGLRMVICAGSSEVCNI